MIHRHQDLCPVCITGFLQKQIIEKTFKYKGCELVIPNYVIYTCDKCGMSLISEDDSDMIEPILRKFHEDVRLGINQTLKEEMINEKKFK